MIFKKIKELEKKVAALEQATRPKMSTNELSSQIAKQIFENVRLQAKF